GPQRHVARRRIVVLQRRRLVQDLVRGHAPTLSHVEWPGSAEVLEEPQLSLAQAAHAQAQLRPAQQVCQRRQRPILDLAAAEVQDDAGAILLQDALQELAGAAELQFPVDAELAATLVLEAVDAHAKSLWIRLSQRKLPRMRWFGRKSARPVVPGRMPRLPLVPKGVRIGAWCAAALFALIAAGVGIIAINCPPVSALKEYKAPQASLVFDRDNKLLARLAPEERIVVPLTAMSPKLVGAILAVEDIRFYEHSGIDWRRVAGAIWRDIRAFSLREGSSTITMQLARNVFPDSLTRARTLRRKLAEMIVARRIEREFTKPQILEMYLNQIYLANGYYGVEAASHGYFERTALELSVSQAALLAALPKAPSNYDPRRF